jgi:nucleoid-associated protein YgaU
MSGIAKRELGSSARWPEIYRIAANRKLIGPDPGLIRPGQNLVMPTK